MLITLPFVLLLLDFWPLKRWNFDPQTGKNKYEKLAALVFEKNPLFILTTIASFATYFIQRGDGAVKSLELFSLQARFNNAMVSYMEYLGKLCGPQNCPFTTLTREMQFPFGKLLFAQLFC